MYLNSDQLFFLHMVFIACIAKFLKGALLPKGKVSVMSKGWRVTMLFKSVCDKPIEKLITQTQLLTTVIRM